MKQLFGLAAIVLSGCFGTKASVPVSKHVPKPPHAVELIVKHQEHLDYLDDRSQKYLTDAAKEALEKSPLYVCQLKPSKRLRDKVPAGQYHRGIRMLDMRMFDVAGDISEPIRIIGHESGHFLFSEECEKAFPHLKFNWKGFKEWFENNQEHTLVRYAHDKVVGAYTHEAMSEGYWSECAAYVFDRLFDGSPPVPESLAPVFAPYLQVDLIELDSQKYANAGRRH